MAWFRRKEKQPLGKLPEIEQYYQAEKRERAGLAWLLALVSIAGAVLIVIGLFFGGRWLYRRMTTEQNKPVTVQTQNENTSEQKPAEENKPSADTQNNQPSNNQSSNAPAQTPSTPNTESQPSSTVTPQQGSATNNNLPTTGPEHVASAFMLTTVIGTLLYRLKLRRKPLL